MGGLNKEQMDMVTQEILKAHLVVVERRSPPGASRILLPNGHLPLPDVLTRDKTFDICD